MARMVVEGHPPAAICGNSPERGLDRRAQQVEPRLDRGQPLEQPLAGSAFDGEFGPTLDRHQCQPVGRNGATMTWYRELVPPAAQPGGMIASRASAASRWIGPGQPQARSGSSCTYVVSSDNTSSPWRCAASASELFPEPLGPASRTATSPITTDAA